MRLQADTITRIQALLQADAALLAQVQSCTDTASAATLIAQTAAENGIEVTAADMLAHVEKAASRQGTLSDTELERISGGNSDPHDPLIFFKFALSFAMGCPEQFYMTDDDWDRYDKVGKYSHLRQQ